MRVTGGRLGGRRLRAAPPGTRPSSDRVRVALFARLGDLAGARVLDLYAGTGTLGIEALSRGAASAVFCERAPRSLAVLRENVQALGLEAQSRILAGDAVRSLVRLGREGARFELVLLDPPYAAGEAGRALAALVAAGVLAPGATVVVESGRRHPLPAVEGLAALDERRYGDSLITRLAAAAPGAGGGSAAPTAMEVAGQAGRRRRPRRQELRMTTRSTQRSVALFPASFDPLTNGHLDIVRRSLKLFDELVVAVAVNVNKHSTFTLPERIAILEAAVGHEPGVRITSFEGLTVDFARQIGASCVIRGVRAMSDFEYEFEMALMNKHLYPEIETLFMMASQQYLYVSSSRLKELVRFGRDVSEFVPAQVAKQLRERIGKP
jgi:pantetheine-phosphate adenylyltransferase